MDPFWDNVVKSDLKLLKSPFLFTLMAQTTQFIGCLWFSLLDLWVGRVQLRQMVFIAGNSVMGFVPFFLMWYFDNVLIEVELPATPPPVMSFCFQLITCAVVGDFFHYVTHRLLHSSVTILSRHQKKSFHSNV